MLAKVPGDRYPALRGREGETDPHRLEGGGCPAPRRLIRPPHLDLDDIEEDELEVEHEHERALGEQRGAQRERGRSWVTLAWAAPGFVWLGFYLIAPLVFIVLMSFWTPDTVSGLRPDWTTANYSELLHPFSLDNAYWKDMLEVVRDLGDRRRRLPRLRLPRRVLPGDEGQEARSTRSPSSSSRWRPSGRASSRARSPGPTRSWAATARSTSFLVKLGVSSYDHPLLEHPVHAVIRAAGDDPALHPVHGHADLLPARAGRPARDRGRARPRRELVRARSARSSCRRPCRAS